MNRLILTFLTGAMVIATGTTFWPTRAWASPFGFDANTFYTDFESSYYQTTQNFTTTGGIVTLPENGQFIEARFNLAAAYDFTNWMEVYSSVGFERNQASFTDPILGSITRANTNFSDVLLGANFRLVSGVVNVIPDISISFPLYPTPAGIDNNVLLGDGAIVVTAKVYVSKRIQSFLLAAYGGYAYRNQGQSTYFPYGLIGHVDLHSFFLELSLDGAASFNNDQYTQTPFVRTAIATGLDASSLIYDAVNPSTFNGTAQAGYHFAGGFFVSGGVSQNIWGENAPLGTRFLLSVGYDGSAGTSGGSSALDNDSSSAGTAGSGGFEVDTKSEETPASPGDEGNAGSANGSGKVITPIH